MRILSIVYGAVYADGPHAGSVTVAITVILFTTVTRCPYVDITQSPAALLPSKGFMNVVQSGEIDGSTHTAGSLYLPA